jgi:hypothetical protein
MRREFTGHSGGILHHRCKQRDTDVEITANMIIDRSDLDEYILEGLQNREKTPHCSFICFPVIRIDYLVNPEKEEKQAESEKPWTIHRQPLCTAAGYRKSG